MMCARTKPGMESHSIKAICLPPPHVSSRYHAFSSSCLAPCTNEPPPARPPSAPWNGRPGCPSATRRTHAASDCAVVGAATCCRSHLLGLVAQAVRLVRAGGAGQTVNLGQLAVLPRPHTEEEAEQVSLLLPPQLLEVLVGPHPATRKQANGAPSVPQPFHARQRRLCRHKRVYCCKTTYNKQ